MNKKEQNSLAKLPPEMAFREGETLIEWLERNVEWFLAEMIRLIRNPNVSHKVRLDALKDLMKRPRVIASF